MGLHSRYRTEETGRNTEKGITGGSDEETYRLRLRLPFPFAFPAMSRDFYSFGLLLNWENLLKSVGRILKRKGGTHVIIATRKKS